VDSVGPTLKTYTCWWLERSRIDNGRAPARGVSHDLDRFDWSTAASVNNLALAGRAARISIAARQHPKDPVLWSLGRARA